MGMYFGFLWQDLSTWEKNLSQMQFSFWSPVLFGKVSRHISTQVHFFSWMSFSLYRWHVPWLFHFQTSPAKMSVSIPPVNLEDCSRLWASALSRRYWTQEQIPLSAKWEPVQYLCCWLWGHFPHKAISHAVLVLHNIYSEKKF